MQKQHLYKGTLSLKKEIIIHIIFWLIVPFFAFTDNVFDVVFDFYNHPLFFKTQILVFIITFYFHYIFIMKRTLTKFRWYKLIFAFLASYLFFVFTRYFIEQIVTDRLFNVKNYEDGLTLDYYLIDNIFYAIKPIILSSLLWLIIYVIRLLEFNNYVISEQKNTEIKFLKAQINPHFIFNTLNNIYSMVYFKSPKSLSAIDKLASIMRFTTYETNKEYINLTDEIDYIKSYIELEELRHDTTSIVDFNISVNNESIKIPPYLLSPLIENALKHGKFSSKNPIKIHLDCTDELLKFNVVNSIGIHKKDKLGGIGLENLKNRLKILYPKKHKLEFIDKDKTFYVNLEIELK